MIVVCSEFKCILFPKSLVMHRTPCQYSRMQLFLILVKRTQYSNIALKNASGVLDGSYKLLIFDISF